MAICNLEARFALAVKCGDQTHAIIPQESPHITRGETIYFYTARGTGACHLLGVGLCISVCPIEIKDNIINLDGVPMVGWEIKRLVVDSGFETKEDLLRFFRDQYGLPFRGVFIEWNPTWVDSTD